METVGHCWLPGTRARLTEKPPMSPVRPPVTSSAFWHRRVQRSAASAIGLNRPLPTGHVIRSEPCHPCGCAVLRSGFQPFDTISSCVRRAFLIRC